MAKKIILFLVFFISLFVKAQVNSIQNTSTKKEDLTDNKINQLLDEERKNGTKEWEIEIKKRLLNEQKNQPVASETSKTTQPPQVNATSCVNPGFENGTSSGWTFFSGQICTNSTSLPCNTCPTTPGALTWVTNATGTYGSCNQDNAGTDYYSGLPAIAPGSGNNYSLLLNNACTNGKIEKAAYSFVVSPSTNIFTFQYSVVLQSGGHAPNAQPYFHVDATDLTTNAVIPCTEYDATAPTSGSLNGWSVSSKDNTVYTYPWTSVALDLSAPAYNGHTIQVEFIVSDCNACGHFGYCYIDASCNSNLITLTKGICPGGGPGILTGPPGFATYSWLNSSNAVVGTSQVLTTSTPGSYTLNTTSSTSCPSPSMFATLTASPDPNPSFTNSVPACGSNVTLTDGSTISSGSIVNWQWNFGDGSPVVNSTTNAAQTHNYSPPGSYVVTLTDSSSGGCKATYTETVNANGGGPAAIFSSNSPPTAPQCFLGNNVVFTNTSTAPAGVTITGYQWNFGDGTTGTSTVGSPNTSHSYTTCGTFVVTLTVTSTTCNGTSTQTVVINPSPTASFSAPKVCIGNSSVFTSTVAATPCTSATYTYSWSFGGAGAGTNTTTATPTFTYSASGTFPVSLTVTAVGGCSVTATNNIQVTPAPTASFSVGAVCQGTGSVFNNTSTADSACAWSFGGAGNPAAATSNCSPTYTYSSPGTFPVTLVVTAVGGCTATATGSAVVNTFPVLGFTADHPCDGTGVNYTNTTTNPASISTWSWNYGDGSAPVAGQTPPAHTYSAAGCYTVVLTATATTGCSGTHDTVVYVHPNPFAYFNAWEACIGDPSEFVDSSFVQNPACLNDQIVGWSYNFGDGTITPYTGGTLPDTIKYTYAVCGPYNISVTVVTNNGCTNTNTITGDTVFCAPTVAGPVDFSVCPAAATPVQTFTTTCANGGTPTAEWFQSLANVNNTGAPPSFLNPGGFDQVPSYNAINPNTSCGILSDTVFAIAISGVGCIGNATFYIANVYPTPTVSPTNDITVCANTAVPAINFTGCPIATETFSWTATGANVGLTSPGSGNIPSFPGQNTTDMPAVTEVDVTPWANGCSGPVSTFSITVNPIPTMTVTSPALYCPSDLVSSTDYQLSTDPPAGVTYTWTATNPAGTGMPANGTGNAPNTPYNAPANASLVNQVSVITYTPSLAGCIGLPVTETVTIKPTPVIDPITSVTYCPNQVTNQINFSCQPTNQGTPNFNWIVTTNPYDAGLNPSTGTTNNLPSFTTSANNTGIAQSANVTLGASLNNCPSTFSNFSIIVNPTPKPKFSASVKVCDGQPMGFTDLSKPNTGSITVNQWAWDMNSDGSIDASAQNPTYTYPVGSAGTNTVTLYIGTSSVPSCTAQTTELVYINPNPVADFVGDSLKACPTLHTNFTNLTTVLTPTTGLTYNWSFGNGNTSTAVTPPQQTYTNSSATQSAYYSITLTATTDSGCINTKTKNKYIQVYPRPIAGFSWGPVGTDIDNPDITFVNQAIGAGPYSPQTYGPHGVQYYLGDIYLQNQNGNTVYGDNAIGSSFSHVYEHYDTATYYVTQWVINTLGCTDEITEPVHIGPNFTFYIPNAFTPNGDGTNEGFKGLGVGIDNSTYNLWVFDRWGLMIFYADDIDKSWDGHLRGNEGKPILQEDVYVWKVKFNDFTGKKHEYHGTVTLLK